ncbi:MAG: type I restriction-modification system subunit M N-terminal domain-containing protein [Clostridia bacterium]|nr:type I restriction-modification system subunit M N-terminal domain-containing protein [Clostridia bacterium]
MTNEKITLEELKSFLWESANILRGSIDSSDFKTYIFALLFYKRLCDVWEEEYDNPNACYEWQKKEDAVRELKKEVKRKTIGVVKDREGFSNKVIEYAKANYYKG